MSDALSRRAFLGAAAGAAAAASLPSLAAAQPASGRAIGGAPAVILRGAIQPAAISSGNGVRAVARAVELVQQGTDTLDAAVEGVKIQELDPTDHSVGYGGLPNEDGVVQCDASCIHGPTRRAGAVGALEGIKTASEVAKLVLKYTDHIMLVGEGAKRFALSYGFEEVEMLTPEARQIWLTWRANRGASDDWVNVPDNTPMVHRPTGTINLNIVNAAGDISSITTTAGLAFKIPGRVGDSPIVGAGQYTDNAVGAAGSTGLGEANIMVCGAFLTVEFMRQGMSPTDACVATLKRVMAMAAPQWIGADRRPKFDLQYYAVSKKGQIGGASLYPFRYAGYDGSHPEASLRDGAHLYERS